jgi:uncharacterized protein (DUF169 family)
MTTGLDVKQALALRVAPIGIAFLSGAPVGLDAWAGEAKPAGCSFWREAQAGRSFYTVAEDHFGCAVGSYTHGIDLPAERAAELNETVGLMVESGYLETAEVPGIPTLAETPRFVAYGPADDGGFAPDVVLITARPAQSMLIYEACLRAGVGSPLTNLLGRPSCAVLPLTVSSNSAAMSLGCAGNRLYAGLRDDELYVALPGARWGDFRARLGEIVAANARMSQYYEAHAADVAAGR